MDEGSREATLSTRSRLLDGTFNDCSVGMINVGSGITKHSVNACFLSIYIYMISYIYIDWSIVNDTLLAFKPDYGCF